jgi:hypothetical protein
MHKERDPTLDVGSFFTQRTSHELKKLTLDMSEVARRTFAFILFKHHTFGMGTVDLFARSR